MRLHGYWRSSAAYRVRIALNLKGLTVEHVPVHLRDNAQTSPHYLARNPQGLVPLLETDDGAALTQSLAIIEWLDETRPEPPLLPADPLGRARVRSLALSVAADVHPLGNLRVLRDLRARFGADQAAVDAWYRHWYGWGSTALETRLAREPETGRFCQGDAPGLADLCLVPHLYNCRRIGLDLGLCPTLSRIDAACLALPAFADAAPERQPDAEG